jgi:uncharacterized membrane protein YcaP (DUF421 family)
MVLVVDGVAREGALHRQMLTADDLLVQLRQHGVTQLSQVQECRLEPDGHISVVTKGEKGGESAEPSPSSG